MFKLDNGDYIMLAHVVSFGRYKFSDVQSGRTHQVELANGDRCRIRFYEFERLVKAMADYIGMMAPKSSVI